MHLLATPCGRTLSTCIRPHRTKVKLNSLEPAGLIVFEPGPSTQFLFKTFKYPMGCRLYIAKQQVDFSNPHQPISQCNEKDPGLVLSEPHLLHVWYWNDTMHCQFHCTVMPMFSTHYVETVWMVHPKPILPEATCPAPPLGFAPLHPLQALHPSSSSALHPPIPGTPCQPALLLLAPPFAILNVGRLFIEIQYLHVQLLPQYVGSSCIKTLSHIPESPAPCASPIPILHLLASSGLKVSPECKLQQGELGFSHSPVTCALVHCAERCKRVQSSYMCSAGRCKRGAGFSPVTSPPHPSLLTASSFALRFFFFSHLKTSTPAGDSK